MKAFLSHYVHLVKEAVKGKNAVSFLKPHLGGYRIGGDYATHIPPLFEKLNSLGCETCLDVGCGEGHALGLMLESGFSEVLGIEGMKKAIKNSPFPDLIVQHDLIHGFVFFDRKYDLVYCSEVVEHIHEKYIGNHSARHLGKSHSDIHIRRDEFQK